MCVCVCVHVPACACFCECVPNPYDNNKTVLFSQTQVKDGVTVNFTLKGEQEQRWKCLTVLPCLTPVLALERHVYIEREKGSTPLPFPFTVNDCENHLCICP